MALYQQFTYMDANTIISTAPYPMTGIGLDGNPYNVPAGPAPVYSGEWVYDDGAGNISVVAPSTDTQAQAQAKLNIWLGQ